MKALFIWLIKDKKRAAFLTCSWSALIFLACLIPGNEVPNVKIPMIDKWVHFVIFAAFSFLLAACYKKVTILRLFIYFLVAVLFGYAVELLQGSGITYGRSFELQDVIADGIGGLIGVVAFYIFYNLCTPKEH